MSEGGDMTRDDALMARMAIVRLIMCLPDAYRADRSWAWAWEELSSEAQEEVKEARRAGEEALIALATKGAT